MLNPVVEVEVLEVKGILAIVSMQHIGGEVWYEEAKAWAEVVGRPDQGTEFIELDVLAIVGQNAYRTNQCEPNCSEGQGHLTMICHSIQRRA